MVSTAFKPAVTRVIEPMARAAVRARITPDMVTLLGTIGSVISAIYFYPRGDLFIGTLIICVFALSDLFDGAIARLSERGASQWGAFLDSTCDRLTDASILGALAVYCVLNDNDIYVVVVASIVFGFLVSYIRAKAESYGVPCTVGLAERTERLIIALTAIGLHGLDIPYALAIGVWLLFSLSFITVIQRVTVVNKGLRQ
ncbi:MAG: phosphatidylinositol phosphate synthase [Candidatus Planktophila sp.]